MTAVSALLMSVVATVGFFSFGLWRFSSRPTPSPMVVASFALGSALLALVAATYLVYAIPQMRTAREFGANLLVPVAVYLGVFIYAVRRRATEAGNLLFVGCVGFVALWFYGFYAGLLVACSFGDCL